MVGSPLTPSGTTTAYSSGTEDYIADMREAREDRDRQVAEEWREMEEEDRQAREEMEEKDRQAHKMTQEEEAAYVRAMAELRVREEKLTCFAKVCRHFGVMVRGDAVSVSQMRPDEIKEMLPVTDYKLFLVFYDRVDDERNHIELIEYVAKSATLRLRPVECKEHGVRTCEVTSFQAFFNPASPLYNYQFFADEEAFGADLEGALNSPVPPAPPSVVGSEIPAGGSNVSHGVVRATRRNLLGKARFRAGQPVAKSYRTSTAIMFNNAEELFQDSVSREYAQEIIENLLDKWGVPMDQPDALKYAEDLLWTFLIAVTASNKADYNRSYDIPVARGAVIADFQVLSALLQSVHKVSRRQFARGVADDLRAFLRHEENAHLLPVLATRVGCDQQFAHLAFDGSTHCTGMTPREVAFTKTLESRNLFESDDVLARGASDRLLGSMDGGRPSARA